VTGRVRLKGSVVTLRPLLPKDLDAVLGSAMLWVTDGAGRSAVRENLRDRVGSSGKMTERELLLGIEVEGRLVGDVQARRDSGPKGVFELGISVFDEGDRGRGYGKEAVALLTSHMFESEGAHRVQLTTDVANASMRAVVERLGFALEGVLRDFWPHPDGYRDYAMYALTRDDYEEVRRTWT